MGYFLWLSDLHLDLWYGTPELAANHKVGDACGLPGNATTNQHPYGRVGCDAPLSLLESTLRHAQTSLKNMKLKNMKSSSNTNSNNDNPLFDFVLVTGDFSRHAMARLNDTQLQLDPMQEAQRTIRTCDDAMLKYLGNIPIIPVLGNNDVVPDYYLETTKTTTNHRHDDNQTNSSSPHSNSNLMLDMVTNSLPNTLSDVDDRESYRNYGYFAKTIVSKDDKAILVVSLNTVLYSQFHEPNHGTNSNGDDVLDEDPLGQFAWLESLLLKATADAPQTTIVGIYLCGHIPPSIGSYRHTQLWHEQYLQRYYGILESYYHSAATASKQFVVPPILGHLFGHVHTEEFRLLDLATASLDTATTTTDTSSFQIPLIVTSSVTPIYGSNPSYKIMEFDDTTGKLLDYTTTYLDLATTDERISNGTVSNAEPVWVTLPSFVQDYNVSDLSAASFETVYNQLEGELNETVATQCNQTGSGSNHTTNITITNSSATPNKDDVVQHLLWATFLDRRDLYSAVPDNGDDGTSRGIHTMIDWLCTLKASRRNAYKDCLASKGHEYYYTIGGDESESSGIAANGNATMTLICNPNEIPLPPPSGIAVLYLVAANVIGIASVLGCFWAVYMTRNGLLRRRKYHKTAVNNMDEEEAVHGTTDERATGHNEQDQDHARSNERTVV